MRTSNHNPKRQILSEHPIANVLKGLIIIILFTIVSQCAFAQVGINNTDPKATLDITVTDSNNPTASDGILVPRVNTLTFTGLNSDQNGMLVYLTTDVTISSVLYLKGFYYWDDSISDWIKVGSGSKNTLDQAYDEGGAGVGRTITADNGAILINGNDGFQNTGTFGFGTFLDLSGPGTRMFFYPRKAAFRVGTVNGNLWDEPFIGNYSTAIGFNTRATGSQSIAMGFSTLASNVSSIAIGTTTIASGTYSTAIGRDTEASGSNSTAMGNNAVASGAVSTAMGYNTEASGSNSTAMGNETIASGSYSIAMGRGTEAPSFAETSIGLFNTIYTPNSDISPDNADRIFSIGNGDTSISRSNALTIYKNGLININDEYDMPLTDGGPNQVMTTNGAGVVRFEDASSLISVNGNTLDQAYDEGGAGAGATINATDGAVTIDGEDGFIVKGTVGSGVLYTFGTEPVMYFNPNDAAFRAGYAIAGTFDSTNAGSGSAAFGSGNMASGDGSFATGSTNIASGYNSASLGYWNYANAFSETAIGTFNTSEFSPNPTISNMSDRLFSIGNGINNGNRSNAFEVYKSGDVVINDEYTLPIADGTANQVMTTNGAGVVRFEDASSLISVNGNTLDQAYDEGGAGAGATINATAGAVTIDGNDGFIVTGAYNGGFPVSVSGMGSRMFFNPRKTAFRAGFVFSTNWDDANIGPFSTAFGYNTLASEYSSTAFGYNSAATGFNSTAMGYNTDATGDYSISMGVETEASGLNSTAMGNGTEASGRHSTAIGQFTSSPSYAETSLGYYNNIYTPSSVNSANNSDKVFSIGNGITNSLRSNALTIYKSGLMNINDEYDMPLTDGSANQIMSTDGSGHVNFVDASSIFTDTDTDNQTIDTFNFNTTTNQLTLEIEDDGIAAQTVDLSSLSGRNTLDEAYDEGGAGAGRTIIVDNGAVVIEGNAGGLSATTSAQLILTETTEDDYSRLRFTNSVDTNNTWTIATRTDDTPSLSRMNFNHNGVGDLFQLWGDGFVEVNGTLEVDGYVGINADNPTYALDVRENEATDFVAQIYNTNTGTNADGLRIQIGTANPGLANTYIGFLNSTGNSRGAVIGNGTGVNYLTTSDQRLKTNIVDVDNALKTIENILPRVYEYKDNLGTKEYGFIAQELQPLYPQAVSGSPDSDVTKNPMMVDYSRLTPILTAGIKELKEEVDTLKTENAILKAKLQQLESLEARLTALENSTTTSEANELVSKED